MQTGHFFIQKIFTHSHSSHLIPQHWAFPCWAFSSWHWCRLSPGHCLESHSPTSGSEELGEVVGHNRILGPRYILCLLGCGRKGCFHGEGCTQPQQTHFLGWTGKRGGVLNMQWTGRRGGVLNMQWHAQEKKITHTFPSNVLSTIISLNNPRHEDVFTSSRNTCNNSSPQQCHKNWFLQTLISETTLVRYSTLSSVLWIDRMAIYICGRLASFPGARKIGGSLCMLRSKVCLGNLETTVYVFVLHDRI